MNMFDMKCESSSNEGEEMDGGDPTLAAQISRCANISSANLDELENSRNESNTVKQTVWAVNCFKTWIREKQINIDFKTIEKPDLAQVLREFYGTIRTSKGELYGINSYLGLRAALNRFFNDPPLHRGWNLMQDPEFRPANNVFKGIVKHIRRSGRVVTTHPPISPEDLDILKHSSALDPGNPRGLLNKVWFDIQLHFGLRGKEGNRHLRPDWLTLKNDQNGFKYFTMVVQDVFRESNNPIKRDKDKKGVAMYEEPGNPLCPVASLEKYLSKIPQDAKALYLQPKRTHVFNDEFWYTALPLGINNLSQMLPRICKEAGTLTTYTNHSLRLTALQKLTESRQIMTVFVHSVHIDTNPQLQQESAPYSASSEIDSSSVTQESLVSSHGWLKQEPENKIIEWENMNSEAPVDAEQDNTSNAISTTTPMEGLPQSVILSISKLQCLVESKQQKIEALEKQVQDLQEDRKFLRTQIENLTSARVVQVPEASISVFSRPRSHKRRQKITSNQCDSDESLTDGSETIDSSEELSNIKKKRHNKKKRKRGYVQYQPPTRRT